MLDRLTALTLACLPGGLGSHLLRAYRERQPLGGQPPGAAEPVFILEAELSRVMASEQARAAATRARDRAGRLLTDPRGCEGVAFGAPEYPPPLAQIVDPPPFLWTRGVLPAADRPSVAIVGSRAASPHSVEVAQGLASALARAGVVIVSGLARGIDAAAHRGAVESGTTVAVLGSGIDRLYPPEHVRLGEAVAACGAVVSELPPGTPPRKAHFPRRNRIISGWSLAVVVVEASLRSGSLITARLALDQGREVMAVPGSVLGDRHRGAHALIRDGALLVEGAADVLSALGLESPSCGCSSASGVRGARDPLLARMSPGEAVELQQLVSLTGLEPADVLRRLTVLELDGAVRRLGGGRYLRPSAAVVR